MNQIISKFSIDFSNPSQTPVVHAVQGECNTRKVEIELFSDGTPWQIPADVSLFVRYGRVNLTGGYYDTLPDGSRAWHTTGNTISLVLAPQMMAVSGIVYTQIEIQHQNSILCTFSFSVNVSANPAVGIVKAENYVNMQHWLERELDQYVEKIKESGEFLGGTMAGPINMNQQKLVGLTMPDEDTAATPRGYVLELLKKAAPQNLLDNSYFLNPVNQRNQQTYAGASIYCIDRWKIGNTAVAGTCTLSNAGITLTPNPGGYCDFVQLIEGYAARKDRHCTIAYKDGDGNIYSSPIIMGKNNGITVGNLEFVSLDEMHIMFRTPVDESVTIAWAALYEGEYSAEILPEYRIKEHGMELAECLRYYQHNTSGLFVAPSEYLYVTFQFPMRIIPTIAATGTNGIECAVSDRSPNGFILINQTGHASQTTWTASADL